MARKSRPRRSAEQTRAEMVEAGLRMLQEHGLTIGLDNVTIEAACIEADVPRSSSHSAWGIDDDFMPQENFRRAVLKAWLLDRRGSMFADAAQEALEQLYARAGGDPSKSAIVRAAIQAAFFESSNTGDRAERGGGDFASTDMAIRFAIASQPLEDRDGDLVSWLEDGERSHRDDRVADSYKPFAELVGLTPKPELGEKAYVLMAIAVASLVEGIGLRQSILPELGLDQPISPAVDDGVPTLMIGACVEALLPVFFDSKDND